MKRILLPVFFVFIYTGCGELEKDFESENAESSIETDQMQSGLYLSKPATKWSKNIIPVCWDAATAPSDDDKKIIQEQVQSQFESLLKIHFSGWKNCTASTPRGITIYNRDEKTNPHVGRLGNGINELPSYMVLNFNFIISTDFPGCSVSPARERCMRAIATHEFGHVLGALHEQVRQDTPSSCITWLAQRGIVDPQYSNANTSVSPPNWPWDAQSLMNYCNDQNYKAQYGSPYNLSWNNNGAASQNDLYGWQYQYGIAKVDYQISTASSPLAAGFSTALFTPPSSLQSFSKPDFYLIDHSNLTGTNTVEVHALSASSSYQSWNVHSGTALPLGVDFNIRYGYTFADFDNDGKPDLFFFQRNNSTGLMEVHALSGASNWQHYNLHTAMPLGAASDWMFAFGDVDGDAIPDLFAVHPEGAGLAVHTLLGSTYYQSVYSTSWVMYPKSLAWKPSNCRFVAGNFYWNTKNPRSDLICMHMDRNSRSTPISIIALRAQDNYTVARKVMDTQFTAEDGMYADFGIWQKSSVSPQSVQIATTAGAFPGEAYSIGFVKRQKASSLQLHYLTSSLYF